MFNRRVGLFCDFVRNIEGVQHAAVFDTVLVRGAVTWGFGDRKTFLSILDTFHFILGTNRKTAVLVRILDVVTCMKRERTGNEIVDILNIWFKISSNKERMMEMYWKLSTYRWMETNPASSTRIDLMFLSCFCRVLWSLSLFSKIKEGPYGTYWDKRSYELTKQLIRPSPLNSVRCELMMDFLVRLWWTPSITS